MGDHVTEIVVFTVLFLLVSGMGFVAARWRRAERHGAPRRVGPGRPQLRRLDHLVPGRRRPLHRVHLRRRAGAGVRRRRGRASSPCPYTIIIYPLVFLVLMRLWSVSHRHGFVTPADFVRARFGSPTLALLVAITGIVATMPYIALQLVGIEAVLKTMGVTGESTMARHLPIIIAFAILAAYTYQSGLRAPALIAFVKDTLIYIVILVAVIYIPYKLGGWGDDLRRGGREVRRVAGARRRHPAQRQQPAAVHHAGVRLGAGAVPLPAQHHRRAGQPEPRRDQAQHVRAAGLQPAARPARAARLHGDRGRGQAAAGRGRHAGQQHDRAAAVRPEFPDWFAGVAFAAIGIGALVPAAIMSIAAANLFTRNIYKEYLQPRRHPGAGGERLARSPRWWSRSARSPASSSSTRSSPSTCSSSAA